MARVVRVLGLVLAALVAVLVATGVWLVFEYRPGPPDPVRRAHQAASALATNVALALLVATAWQRRLRPALLALACFAAVVAAGVTGFLLPWDQLGLWAVTVGSDIDGVLTAASDDVRFVLIGGVEIDTDTYRRWLVVHTVGIPAVAGVVAGTKFLLRR